MPGSSAGGTTPHHTAASAPSTEHRAHQHQQRPHGERHTIATTRVVLYPTIRQWNGCPSDKRQLVWSWCVVHAVRGRTGGRTRGSGASLGARHDRGTGDRETGWDGMDGWEDNGTESNASLSFTHKAPF